MEAAQMLPPKITIGISLACALMLTATVNEGHRAACRNQCAQSEALQYQTYRNIMTAYNDRPDILMPAARGLSEIEQRRTQCIDRCGLR
jgi:hypothetical protein